MTLAWEPVVDLGAGVDLGEDFTSGRDLRGCTFLTMASTG